MNNTTKNFQLVLAFLGGMILVGVFVLGRITVASNDIPPSTDTDTESIVTAEDEYLAQLEFVEEQKTKAYQRGESKIADRLQYESQHPTFNRNLSQDYDYMVGGNGVDQIANYIIHKTKDLPHPYGGKMGLDLAKTWSAENDRYIPTKQGPLDELGICQLRYKYHKSFMDSQEFFDPYNQVDYCVDVYLDRYNRKRSHQSIESVWTQRSIRESMSSRFRKL